jgi:hypothetical protein
LWDELGCIVGKESGFVARAGDRDVAKSRIEQFRVDAGIGVHEDALGGEALRTVTGDCVAVIEVAMFLGIKLNLSVVVEAG